MTVARAPVRGLTDEQAAALLAEVGANTAAPAGEESLLEELLESLREPLQLLLIAVGVIYAALGELRDALIILGVVVCVAAAETWTEWRAGHAVAALSRLAAPVAHVWRGGRLVEVPTAGVVPGDLLALTAGSRVPADAQVVAADGLALDESLVSGEAEPVEHGEGPGRDALLAGTHVVRGSATAVVTATGSRSTLGRISAMVREAEQPRTPLQRQMGELAGVLLIVALAVSVLVPAVGVAMGQPARDMLLTGLTLAFATIPEELPILVVVVLGLGSLELARRGAIVRRLVAAETLGATTVVCSDKTGTLTQNRLALASVLPAGPALGRDGAGPGPVLAAARMASEPPPGAAAVDPIDAAVWEGATGGVPASRLFPFDSATRLSTGIGTDGGVTRIGVKGAPEAVLERSVAWRGPGGAEPLTAGLRTRLAAVAEDSGRRGRVIAVASRTASVTVLDRAEAERDLVFEGLCVLADPLRPEVPQAVDDVRRAGIAVSVVTGDQPATAASIAAQVGIVADGVVTGAEITGWDDARIAAVARRGSVFARVQPGDKLRIVEALGRAGEVVAVTGDGVNDAPALRAAAIGVAMGEHGSDVAREAADLVLTDDNFATIARAVRQGRRLYDNLRKGVCFYLSVKVALVLASLGAALARAPLPFTPVQIVVLELVMDLGASTAFVSLQADDDVMRRAPRPPAARFLDGPVIRAIAAGGATLAAITGGTFAVAIRLMDVDSARALTLIAWLVGHTILGVVTAVPGRPSPASLRANPALMGWLAAAWGFAALAVGLPPLRDALHMGAVTAPAAAAAAAAGMLGPLWMIALRSPGRPAYDASP